MRLCSGNPRKCRRRWEGTTRSRTQYPTPERGQICSFRSPEQSQPLSSKVGSFAANDHNSDDIRDTWILDSGANLHVCDDRTRFKFERAATEDDSFSAGKTVYPIEAYGSVEITVRIPTGLGTVTLLDVALAPGFLTAQVYEQGGPLGYTEAAPPHQRRSLLLCTTRREPLGT